LKPEQWNSRKHTLPAGLRRLKFRCQHVLSMRH